MSLSTHPRQHEKTRGGARSVTEETDGAIFIAAIRNREVLSFVYQGEPRVVELQTYGRDRSGERLLRARQTAGGSRSGQERIAKLWEEKKISALKKTGDHFEKALPEHNPQDSAMVEIFATLPRPETLSHKQGSQP